MVRTPNTLDETSAIEVAKDYLAKRLPDVVAESVVNAEHIAGAKRVQQLRELETFARIQGGPTEGLAERHGMNEDHWLIRFFVEYPEGTAGTIPPTMVRVYESDSRVEFVWLDRNQRPNDFPREGGDLS